MFTGIVQGKGKIIKIDAREGLKILYIDIGALHTNITQGASISISGVCLTAVGQESSVVIFDVMDETLQKTTLGILSVGDVVNVERSAKFGDEIGGHVISGHVHAQAQIINIENPTNNHVITCMVDGQWMPYIFSKGFIALDGASLTVVDANIATNTFKIWFIPETLQKTTFGLKKIGDHVNMEIDLQTKTIVDTVERVLAENKI